MKKFSQWLAGTVVIALLLSGLPSSVTTAQFSDVTANTSYDDSIATMAEIGIITGHPDGTFRPNDSVSRYEMAAILSRALDQTEDAAISLNLNLYEGSTTKPFPDVPAGEWFTPVTSAMKAKKIIEGFPDGKFKGTQCVNRVEMVKMGLLSFMGSDFNPPNKYFGEPKDLDGDAWYWQYMSKALYANLLPKDHIQTLSFSSYNYFPGECASRAEATEFVYRLKALADNNEIVYTEDLKPAKIVTSGNPKKGFKILAFNSETDLDNHFRQVALNVAEPDGFGGGAPVDAEPVEAEVGEMSDDSAGDFVPFSPQSDTPSNSQDEDSNLSKSADESITNNQEENVDEGGIVKAWGDYFVILKSGRLFTVKVDEPLEAVDQINVYDENFESTWIDEMLVSDDKVIVIGYSYAESATEVSIFNLSSTAELSFEDRYYIDSFDYYSSENYASRLVGDELIFYIPYYFAQTQWHSNYYDETTEEGWTYDFVYPEFWKAGDTEGTRIIDAEDIYYTDGEKNQFDNILHTVVKCDLSGSEMDCDAKGILGGYSRNFYVSEDNIYVWVSDGYYYSGDRYGYNDRSNVFQINIDTLDVEGLQTYGQPIDQFSFKEADGYLNVFVRENSSGEGMWSSNFSSGDIAMLRVPTSRFSQDAPAVDIDDYQKLPKLSGWSIENRFVGDLFVYTDNNTITSLYEIPAGLSCIDTYAPDDPASCSYIPPRRYLLNILDYTNPDKPAPQQQSLDQYVSRIENMGGNIAVVGSDGADLIITAINDASDVDGVREYVKDNLRLPNLSEGESRSHGFFYKPQADGTGIIGLPVVENNWYNPYYYEDYRYQEPGSSMIYVEVDREPYGEASRLTLEYLGELEAKDTDFDDMCEVSCVDWYGSDRPIFYQGRIFALLGYELVEGELVNGKIEEVDRLKFLRTELLRPTSPFDGE